MRRALILATLLTAPATGSVPPPPPDDAPIIAASCGATKTYQPFDEVPATVTQLAPETLPVTGRLHRRWGFRIATDDARVTEVAGMEFSGFYGLLAVTRGGKWLSLDLRSGTLAGIRSVGIAAMKGAPGVPTSVATSFGDRTYVAFGGAHPVIARYALDACGETSSAVPILDLTGTTDPVMVQAAATYLGIVGRRADEGSAITLAYGPESLKLAGPNLLDVPGRTLVAASNPARIVPEIIVARRDARGRTDVALVPVEAWEDVRGGPPRPETPLATLPRAPSAMASFYSSQDRTTLVILAYPGPRAGTLDVYAFDTDVAL